MLELQILVRPSKSWGEKGSSFSDEVKESCHLVFLRVFLPGGRREKMWKNFFKKRETYGSSFSKSSIMVSVTLKIISSSD